MNRLVEFLVLCLLVSSTGYADEPDYRRLSLTWKAPTSFTNGERMDSPRTQLREYRVFYGDSREGIRQHHFTVSADATSVKLDRLDGEFVKSTPVIYLAVSAVSKQSVESRLSEIVFFLP